MAWIKMRGNLRREPKVLAMARWLCLDEHFETWYRHVTGCECDVTCDVEIVTRVTVASLLEVWHCVNESIGQDQDEIEHLSIHDIDMMCGVWGIGRAMEKVGWIEKTPKGVRFPDFREHNNPVKERGKPLSGAERTARYRAKKGDVTDSDECDAREDKSREEKKREKDIRSTDVDPAPSSGSTTYPSAFESWWKHYPRKVGKKKALAAWKRNKANQQAMLSAVIEFARSEKGQGEYCPHPATWLNEGR